MADNHKGYGVPIGGVVAYRDAISPSGVGFDIGCGVKAVKTTLKASALYDGGVTHDGGEIRLALLREIKSAIPFGIGKEANLPDSYGVMDDHLWDSVPEPIQQLKSMAAAQLGTVGSGNHYIDLLRDDEDYLWIACHFGSRGLGHKIATHFLKELNAKDDMDSAPTVIVRSRNPALFDSYRTSMELAGQYATAGRNMVIDRVLKILGTDILDSVHNHHNFAWFEEHDGEQFVIVRKGATPAYPGQRGFVGGSMGDFAAIVSGRDTATSLATLRSTVHGSGRVLSRTAAAGKYKKTIDPTTGKKRKIRQPGAISYQQHLGRMEEWDVIQLGGELDESPFAYRELKPVLDAMGDSIAVETFLTPIAVAMAGSDEYDPYKD
jgi:tRNA-splicing ligase RtcB